jgi:hypothetical protein
LVPKKTTDGGRAILFIEEAIGIELTDMRSKILLYKYVSLNFARHAAL